jgi:excinuclease UvrABC ATPase subunit
MKKTGRQRIPIKGRNVYPARCANCGGEGVCRVTYEDMYCKLTVTLCEECEKVEYGQLKLQSQIEWPVEAVKA